MPRGMSFRTYTADNGDEFQTLVDSDEATDAARGWGVALPGTDMLPRAFKERRVHGLSATTGRRGSCRVGALTADLWTGVATAFTVEANDNTTDTMTVTSRTGERRRLSH